MYTCTDRADNINSNIGLRSTDGDKLYYVAKPSLFVYAARPANVGVRCFVRLSLWLIDSAMD